MGHNQTEFVQCFGGPALARSRVDHYRAVLRSQLLSQDQYSSDFVHSLGVTDGRKLVAYHREHLLDVVYVVVQFTSSRAWHRG